MIIFLNYVSVSKPGLADPMTLSSSFRNSPSPEVSAERQGPVESRVVMQNLISY